MLLIGALFPLVVSCLSVLFVILDSLHCICTSEEAESSFRLDRFVLSVLHQSAQLKVLDMSADGILGQVELALRVFLGNASALAPGGGWCSIA